MKIKFFGFRERCVRTMRGIILERWSCVRGRRKPFSIYACNVIHINGFHHIWYVSTVRCSPSMAHTRNAMWLSYHIFMQIKRECEWRDATDVDKWQIIKINPIISFLFSFSFSPKLNNVEGSEHIKIGTTRIKGTILFNARFGFFIIEKKQTKFCLPTISKIVNWWKRNAFYLLIESLCVVFGVFLLCFLSR